MNDFTKGLLLSNIEYIEENIHSIDLGRRGFLIKMCINLVLRKVKFAIETNNINNFDWKQILSDLVAITK